jgi:hypothetical protein
MFLRFNELEKLEFKFEKTIGFRNMQEKRKVQIQFHNKFVPCARCNVPRV